MPAGFIVVIGKFSDIFGLRTDRSIKKRFTYLSWLESVMFHEVMWRDLQCHSPAFNKIAAA